MRKQSAWVWDNPVGDGYGGYSYDAPEHILVRWEEKREEFRDASGNLSISNAIVYTGQDVAEGAMLMLDADFSDSSGAVPTDPTDSAIEAWTVRKFEKLPTLDAKDFLRTCIL